jgi:predicted RNase H-like HicB family nuclease
MLEYFNYRTDKYKEADGSDCYVVQFLDDDCKFCSAVGNTLEEAIAEAEIAAGLLLEMKEEEVLDFIYKFKSSASLFQHGMCYWFAFILKERFNGQIYYHSIDNHFATKIKGALYDSLGKLGGDGFEPWEEYKEKDELETKRIIRDCIKKRRVGY